MDLLVLAVLGVVILLLLLLASVAGGNLASVSTSGDRLFVTLRGLNKLWAFKNQIEVPSSAITGVEVKPKLEKMPLGLRMPGTSVPGIIIAGSYRIKGERHFYAIRRGDGVLIIDLQGERYDKLVLETADPISDANTVRSVLASN